MKNPFLKGKIIYLSPITREDISEEYISWLNDSEVCEGNSHSTYPNNYEKTLSYIDSVTNSKTDLVFTVRLKKNDLHIGNASLQNINYINRSGEMAILIGNKNYWGKGVSTEILSLLIEYGFMTLDLNRISAATPLTNKGGLKICENNKMVREGVMREAMFKEGKHLDVAMYSILKKDYKKNSKKQNQ